MRVLVTGGAGFIDRHLVTSLLERGDDAIVVDRVVGHELSDASVVRDVFRIAQADIVVHLAATCSTPRSVTAPMETYRDTVQTAVNVVEMCRLSDTPVIVTSSVKARDGRTPYGAAKRMVEDWVAEYKAAYSLPVVINRPGTIYGPGQEGSLESGWIAWFCRARAERRRVTINGSGYQQRDLLHVSDYVRLLLLQIDQHDEFSKTKRMFDVGGGSDNVVTVLEVAQHLGLMYTFGPPRYGDSPSYIGQNNVRSWRPLVHWRDSEVFNVG